jgi:hypothetical protein
MGVNHHAGQKTGEIVSFAEKVVKATLASLSRG